MARIAALPGHVKCVPQRIRVLPASSVGSASSAHMLCHVRYIQLMAPRKRPYHGAEVHESILHVQELQVFRPEAR